MRNISAGKSRKLIAVLVSLLLVAALAVSGTLAWLTDGTDPVTNTFKAGEIKTMVDESFSNNVKTNVKITNTGTVEGNGVDAYIRAYVVVTWQKLETDGSYSVAAETPTADDYTIEYNLVLDDNGGEWVLGEDGFYYWTMPVAPGSSTGVLIKNCQLTENAQIPDGYYLCVEIISSAIQTLPSTVVKDEWSSVTDVNTETQALTVTTATN